MLSAHVHIICLSSLTLLIYPIIHNLVSIHIVSTNAHCQYHLYIVCRCICYVHVLISTAVICIYVHVIRILSEHMCIMRTLSAVVLDIFLPNRQCWYHPYVISSTLYISYHVQLSFCTLSAQMHIVHIICMLSTHVHIICLSSLPLLIYLIIHNLVSAHCLHTCILCVTMSSVFCLEMHMLCTCHLSYFVVFL